MSRQHLPFPARTLSCAALFAFATFGGNGLAAQTVWYVNAQAASGNGSSWASPFVDLQDAINAAQSGDQIWVARGIYLPSVPSDPTDPRTASFVMPHGVAIYGGFAGYEATLARREKLFDATILCGDIGTPGIPFDNSYHVVVMNGTTSFVTSTLDGFTVRDGYGQLGALSPSRGAGITVRLAGGTHTPTLVVRNCTIRDNTADIGGGIAVTNLGKMVISHSKVIDNFADLRGGGAFVQTGYLLSANTCWIENGTVERGGAVYVNSTAPGWVRFTNDVMTSNEADEGGAIYVAGGEFTNGSAHVDNCTIARNFANDGVSVFADTAAATPANVRIRNSILWHEPPTGPATLADAGSAVVVQFSCVLGGPTGNGNIDTDPMFVDSVGGNLRLLAGSPCNDAGENAILPADYCDLDGDGNLVEVLPIDKDGGRRIADDLLAPNTGLGTPPVDMGAYEY